MVKNNVQPAMNNTRSVNDVMSNLNFLESCRIESRTPHRRDASVKAILQATKDRRLESDGHSLDLWTKTRSDTRAYFKAAIS